MIIHVICCTAYVAYWHDSDEPIIARYVRSLGWSGLSTDDASLAVHDPEQT